MAVLDLANNYTIEVKFCTYNVVSVIINLDANLFYLFIICLFFIYIICVDLGVVLGGSSFWADWNHCILYSTHHSSLPEKEHN